MSAVIWMKIVLLRKEDLSSEGRVIYQIYVLARIVFIYYPINTINVCKVAILDLLSYLCCIHIVCYIDVMYSKTGAECSFYGFSRFCKRKLFFYARPI